MKSVMCCGLQTSSSLSSPPWQQNDWPVDEIDDVLRSADIILITIITMTTEWLTCRWSRWCVAVRQPWPLSGPPCSACSPPSRPQTSHGSNRWLPLATLCAPAHHSKSQGQCHLSHLASHDSPLLLETACFQWQRVMCVLQRDWDCVVYVKIEGEVCAPEIGAVWYM